MWLATEDTQLQRRARAALVQRANQLKHRDDETGLFGCLVLAKPNSHQWDAFLNPVITDPDVLEAIALAPDNSQVFVTNVTDEEIVTLIGREVNQTYQNYIPGQESGDE